MSSASGRRTRPSVQVTTYLYLTRAYERLRDLYLSAPEKDKPPILNELKAIRQARLWARQEFEDVDWPDTRRVPLKTIARGEKVVCSAEAPPPPARPPGCKYYPWYELQVGDSVFLRRPKNVVREDLRLYRATTGGVHTFFVGSDPKKGTWVWRTA